MFARPDSGEHAVLVHVDIRGAGVDQDISEFRELAEAAGVLSVAVVTANRDRPDPRFYVGGGKLAEIQEQADRLGANLVLFDNQLSPAQQRNLERVLGRRVLDRTEVILDIFAQRASSFEGKLQVELAQLRYLSTRLIRGWTHLERQRGGIGLRGPGESQLETDRRLVGKRIEQIQDRLERVRRQRQHSRRLRRKATLSAVSIIGYTNAGKSTLFNRLTGARAFVADQLFATLDAKTRRIDIAGIGGVTLNDTVGFVRQLPHDLVAAFRATLEETREADLLLHVVDASSSECQERIEQVHYVLDEIGANDVPVIEVFTKIDRIDGCEPCVEYTPSGQIKRVWVSAKRGSGLDLLEQAIGRRLTGKRVSAWVRLEGEAGRVRSRLYDAGVVRNETVKDDGAWLLQVEMTPAQLDAISAGRGVTLCPHGL